MNILLLNLTRFGDLLQGQAAVSDLKKQGHKVGIVCLENFSQAAALLQHVSYVSAFPGSSLLRCLNDIAPSQSALHTWPEAFARLYTWRSAVQAEFPFDQVCNLTPTLSARLLSRFLAKDAPIVGFGVDTHGFGTTSNAWAAFLQGAAASRGVSPFNIVDLFRKSAVLPE